VTTPSHKGSCFCGAVVIEVTGAPQEMGYCHCTSCRAYSGGPVKAYTLWNARDVKVLRGVEFLGRFQKSRMTVRRFCMNCGGHLIVEHPGLGITDIYAAMLPTVTFTPSVHLHYAEAVLKMRDGLPKLRDFPASVGGSGEAVPE
jgi:hypothetical protein